MTVCLSIRGSTPSIEHNLLKPPGGNDVPGWIQNYSFSLSQDTLSSVRPGQSLYLVDRLYAQSGGVCTFVGVVKPVQVAGRSLFPPVLGMWLKDQSIPGSEAIKILDKLHTSIICDYYDKHYPRHTRLYNTISAYTAALEKDGLWQDIQKSAQPLNPNGGLSFNGYTLSNRATIKTADGQSDELSTTLDVVQTGDVQALKKYGRVFIGTADALSSVKYPDSQLTFEQHIAPLASHAPNTSASLTDNPTTDFPRAAIEVSRLSTTEIKALESALSHAKRNPAFAEALKKKLLESGL